MQNMQVNMLNRQINMQNMQVNMQKICRGPNQYAALSICKICKNKTADK